MPKENVEVVRRAFERAGRQPRPDHEVLSQYIHPDHVLVTDFGPTERDQRVGEAGFLRAIEEMDEAWEEWHQELDEFVDVAPETVIVLGRLIARGRASGYPVEGPWAAVVTLRDGKLASTRWFVDVDEAFASVGIDKP